MKKIVTQRLLHQHSKPRPDESLFKNSTLPYPAVDLLANTRLLQKLRNGFFLMLGQ